MEEIASEVTKRMDVDEVVVRQKENDVESGLVGKDQHDCRLIRGIGTLLVITETNT